MPSTEDDRDVKRLKTAAQSLISTLQTKQLGADFRVLKHFKVKKTDTRGWHAIFAELPISEAKLDLWLDKSQGGSQRHFWVCFWTRGRAAMNNIVLNAPPRFAPTLSYQYSHWKPVGPSYQLKTVTSDHGSEPIYEYYTEEGCYFGLAETSKRGAIDLGRFSDFICKVVRAVDAGSFDNQTKDFENEVRKSLGDPPDLRRQRLSNAPRLPKVILRRVRDFVRNADVVAEVLFQARATCGSCGNSAPFTRAKDKTPYLEVHHKKQLSAGGEDTVENAIALCPNCHRKAHFG